MNEVISVIVPVYNAEATLSRCLDSICRQTYPHLEIFLIDDGSTDGSSRIAESYAVKDGRIHILHKENGGISSARNMALDRVTGFWIAFADADDYLEENAFETVLSAGQEADICIFGRVSEFAGKSREFRPSERIGEIGRDEALRRMIVRHSIGFTSWDKLYRAQLFEGIRFPDGYDYEDIRTTYRVFLRAERFVLLPDILYHYVQYDSSVSHTESLKNRLDHWSSFYQLYRVFGRRREYADVCLRKCAHSLFRAYGTLWRTDRGECAREKQRISEMLSFARRHRNEVLFGRSCGPAGRAGVLLASTGIRFSVLMAYFLNQLYLCFVSRRHHLF